MKKNSAKNKTVKFISALLIVSIMTPVFLFSIPKQAKALLPTPAGVPVNDFMVQTWTGTINTTTLKQWAQTVLEQMLKTVAKQILAKMTQATVNWINSDFHGSPLFLENPDSFFRDITKSELKSVVDTFGYDSLLYPFGKQFALNAISSYKRQLSDNAGYTLSKVMNSQQQMNFRNNFNYGGWNGFLINTQYPQNNYLGFQMIATETLASKLQGTVQAPAQKYQSLLQQGMGFLSPQICPEDINPNYNNGTNEFVKPSFQYDKPLDCGDFGTEAYTQCVSSWRENRNKEKLAWEKANTCLRPDGTSGLVNTTPGSVAANQVMTALESPFLTTALDGAIGNSLAIIFDTLLAHFLDKGLNKLSSTINPEPIADNWSYGGNTLDDRNTPIDTLNIPQNVSIIVGQTTSTIISGGRGDYSIQPQSLASRAIAVATIDVSGPFPRLQIRAGAVPGTTSITVQDSSSPAQTTTVTITVNAVGALVVTPANISTSANRQIIATISGGVEPYSIQMNPDETIALATLASTRLVVSSIANGATFVDIRDSSTPIKTVRVRILVGPDVLTVTPSNISVNVGEVTNLFISNGTPPYVVINQQNINVATAEILPNTPDLITVTGRARGTTSVTVQDSSIPTKTTTVNITTNTPQ